MKYLFLIAYSILTFPSLAQERVWTLEACIDTAIGNSIVVQRSQLNQASTRTYHNQSKAQLFPTIAAAANHSYNFGRNINPVTNTFQDVNIRGNQFALNGSLPLFNGLQTQFRIRETKVNNMAAQEEMKQSKNEIMLKVVFAYLEVLFNQELVKSAKWQLENANARAHQMEKSLQAGILSKNQVLEAQALQATDEMNVTIAENSLALSVLALRQLLLLPPSEQMELSMPVMEPASEESPLAVESIYAKALTFMPAPKRANLLVRSAKLKEYGAKGARLPRLVLAASAFSTYAEVLGKDNTFDFNQQMRNNFGQNVRLALDIPLFNAWQTRTTIQAAVVNRKNAELNALETENNLRQEIEKAYLNKKTAYKKYIAAQKQAEVLKENFRMAEKKLDAGTINLVEFGTTKNNLSKAESECINAKYDYMFKAKIVDFYQNN